jgi:protein-L-isoaspartate(D-aspartate) O-methyltransferase
MRDIRKQSLCHLDFNTYSGRSLISAISVVVLVGAYSGPVAAQSPGWFEQARKRMVDDVLVAAGIKDARVLKSSGETPRHEFVAPEFRRQAYFDMALPIGDKQTISSPFIVAYMTESLDPRPTDKVLEIGTGSGYQAAILSPLVQDVYTIEIVERLGLQATRTLERLGYKNVHTKVGDGFKGWPEHAPFDKIIVTCSPEKVPQPLIDQLREGGLMVIPVGQRYQQTLYLLRKKDGKLESESLRPTLFVPMTGVAEDNRQVKPDPANPQIANGDFELQPPENGFLPGWYYQRQLTWLTGAGAPQGQHYVVMENRDSGRAAHVMQGFPIDGRKVVRLDLSAWVKYEGTRRGPSREAVPVAAVSFYDERREDIGYVLLGPFLGDSDWRKVSRSARVPAKAREGILRLGLFGATGKIYFDDVRMTTVKF